MHKKTYILLFTLSICLLIGYIGCRKYPEDPSISLLTMRTRMSGEWQFEKIEINGEDIRYKYNDSLAPLTINDFWFWIQFSVHDYGEFQRDFFFINKKSKKEWEADKTDVCGLSFANSPRKNKEIWFGGGAASYVPYIDKYSSRVFINIFGSFKKWKIKKLYKNKMILETEYDGVVHRLYFIQTRSK